MSEYKKRAITFSIALGTGGMGLGSGSEITVEGLRVLASFTAYNGLSQPQFHMSVFGMPLDMINELTTIGVHFTERRKNKLTVKAGEQDGDMPIVFQGIITAAYGDFQAAPDVVFNVIALSSAIDSAEIATPLVYPEETAAADIIGTIAGNMELNLEMNGVDTMLKNRAYNGSNLSQLQQICTELHLEYSIDRGTLAVWKIGEGKRNGVFDISPDTGMVGYPQFNSNYLMVETLLAPDIVCGSIINVTSEITPANGQWQVVHVTHDFESEMPNGQWFTRIEASRWSG